MIQITTLDLDYQVAVQPSRYRDSLITGMESQQGDKPLIGFVTLSMCI